MIAAWPASHSVNTFTAGRTASPYVYWLVRWPARRDRPEVTAFEYWLLAQAAITRRAIDTLDTLDTQAAEMAPSIR